MPNDAPRPDFNRHAPRRPRRPATPPCARAAGLLPAGAGAGSEQGPAARVVLVSPANGVLIQRSHVTFVWRVEWPRPVASGAVQVSHRYASDRAMTQQVSTTTRTCPAADVNCWTYRPKETFFGRYYWQVSLSGALQASSTTHLLSVTGPRDRFDRSRPSVRALGGSASRGRRALPRACQRQLRRGAPGRTAHSSRPARRAKAELRSGHLGRRRDPQHAAALALASPGVYRLCVTAWDRAGNRSQSCARYRVR